MVHYTARVIENSPVAEGYMHLSFSWENHLPAPLPGQFITIGNPDSTDPLLRRPFAFASRGANICSVVYQIRGKATHSISARREGDAIDVLGPLGNVFPDPPAGSRPVLVAGGIGFGPVYFLANTMIQDGSDPILIVGARTASLIPDVPYPEGTAICTDDGSRGFGGSVADYLETLADEANLILYACGPEAMLAACARFSAERSIQCWVSMEQIMGCAVGACMGCVIRVKGDHPYARVCTEGPVFNAEDVIWS